MKRLRSLVFALVAVLVIIVVLQNTQSVETRILFVNLSMPRAVLLCVTLLVGVVLGLVIASWRGRERDIRTGL